VEPISGSHGSAGGRAVVTFQIGDTVQSRSPNHHEAGRLRTFAGEPVVEIRRTDHSREVYRSSLVAFAAPDTEVLSLVNEAAEETVTERILLSGANIIFGGQAEAPDLGKPQWRQIYEDIRSDIETGRLAIGDQLPTVSALAGMYTFSSPGALKALHILQAEGWIVGRQRLGRFVRSRLSSVSGSER
jgi:DNA-binding GntR family transcriptional regulator